MEHMYRILGEHDITAWLSLAKEVEPLFGPMTEVKEFQESIRQCLMQGNALGIEVDQRIVGIIAVDRTKNEIAWLAVDHAFRGKKYGEALVAQALAQLLDPSRPVSVQTFSAHIPEGTHARRLYSSLGFTDHSPGGKNPAGIDTIIMIKQPLRKTS